MFNLFGKKSEKIVIKDTVWMTCDAKYRAMSRLTTSVPVVFAAWFDNTVDEATAHRNNAGIPIDIYSAQQLKAPHIKGQRLIFLEHYPLPSVEETLYRSLQLKTVEVWSAMDEPLFQMFGGERISELMKKLGMSPDEEVEHKMVSSAIRNAQVKIAKKTTIGHRARSQAEWLRMNVS